MHYNGCKMQKAPYIIKEAALIFESGSNKYLDYVIGVKAPQALRIQRTMDRDNISAQQVEDTYEQANGRIRKNAAMRFRYSK